MINVENDYINHELLRYTFDMLGHCFDDPLMFLENERVLRRESREKCIGLSWMEDSVEILSGFLGIGCEKERQRREMRWISIRGMELHGSVSRAGVYMLS